jgi:phosphatidylglycerophosphatase C
MRLLIYDLDGTLTKSDSIIQFSKFMIINQKEWRFLFVVPLMALLKIRLLNNQQFKILYAKWIMKNYDIEKLTKKVTEYLNSEIFKEDLNENVVTFLSSETDLKKIVLSANYSFLVKPISESLNISESISINLEKKGSKFTGNIIGPIPYGSKKIDTFVSFMKGKKYSSTIGLADSMSDIPFLEYLDEGYLIRYHTQGNKTDFIKVKH